MRKSIGCQTATRYNANTKLGLHYQQIMEINSTIFCSASYIRGLVAIFQRGSGGRPGPEASIHPLSDESNPPSRPTGNCKRRRRETAIAEGRKPLSDH